MILIVAGVSGSGKTTVGALLAGQLGWRFADADTFHPASNVEGSGRHPAQRRGPQALAAGGHR